MSSVRLRCPACLEGRLFAGLFAMRTRCSSCGLVFEREPGYWLGAIYFNYGLAVALMIACYLGLESFSGLGPGARLALSGSIGIAAPLLFFRHARALWMSIDRYFDPDDAAGPRRRPGA